ncbi:MAG TPA: maleylpyruvate isomerase N-terminal domain-containing protein [Streptosporangiaceae bacterium]|nr:maleylpyruvate isomerase N-terminal domain-containing protein [Streptosporangiaceae bacterium]
MIEDRAGMLTLIDAATERLLAATARLDDQDVRRPSLLPGWTRGHVLTHVARNGEALRNLLTWARTGVETPAYASLEARDRAIEEGAGRTATELHADLTQSAAAFRAAVAMMPEEAWDFVVSALNVPELPMEQVLVRRLNEVVLHHTDLDIGYKPADWPSEFAHMDLPEPMRSQREDRRAW